MMKAGVPLVQAFDIVADGFENEMMKGLIFQIRDDVAAGGSFANALRKHPRYFDNLFCSLVDSGETAGAWRPCWIGWPPTRKNRAAQGKDQKAMTYPLAVMVVAIVVTAILLIKVVPVFAETFSSFGADLPAFTLFVLGPVGGTAKLLDDCAGGDSCLPLRL